MEELDNYFAEVSPDAPGLLFNHLGIRIDTPLDSLRWEIGRRQRLAATPIPTGDRLLNILEGKAHGKDWNTIADESPFTTDQLKHTLRYSPWPIDPRTQERLHFERQGRANFLVYGALLQQKIQPPRIELPFRTIERILTTKRITALAGVALGFSREEMGDGYERSPATAKTHFASLFQLLRARSHAHAVGLAFGCGILKTLRPQTWQPRFLDER